MKKFLYTILVAATMTSCVINNSISNEIPASKNILQTDTLETFSLLKANSVASVDVINNTDSAGIIVYDMPQSVFENLNVHINNDTLVIDSKDDSKKIQAEKVLITIYISERLNECTLNGVGDINIGKNTTDSIFAIELNGVGDINTTDIITTRLSATLNGVGNVNINGTTNSIVYTLNGVGDINAKRMKAINVFAKNSGVGDINCYASTNFEGESSGVGNIECYGQPTTTTISGNNIIIK